MEATRMCCLVALVASIGSLHAQRPERQQEVRVPGIGVALKAGWQLFFCDGCRFAVPALWRASSDGRSVFAPDGSTLSVRMVSITSWPAHWPPGAS
jgi:hypothetical protein